MGIKVPLNHFNSDRHNPFRKPAADSCLDTALSLYNNSEKVQFTKIVISLILIIAENA